MSEEDRARERAVGAETGEGEETTEVRARGVTVSVDWCVCPLVLDGG